MKNDACHRNGAFSAHSGSGALFLFAHDVYDGHGSVSTSVQQSSRPKL